MGNKNSELNDIARNSDNIATQLPTLEPVPTYRRTTDPIGVTLPCIRPVAMAALRWQRRSWSWGHHLIYLRWSGAALVRVHLSISHVEVGIIASPS